MTLLLQTVFAFALASSVLVAFRRGERDEKCVAVALLIASLATPLAQTSAFDTMQYGIFVVDALLLMLLVYVALTSRRYWPMFAAGFQLTILLFHLATDIGVRVVPAAYADSIVIWSYLVVATLLLGTFVESARREPQP